MRFWLTSTPPLPDTAQAAAQAKGRERYEGFVEALGRRLARGQTLRRGDLDDVAVPIRTQALDQPSSSMSDPADPCLSTPRATTA